MKPGQFVLPATVVLFGTALLAPVVFGAEADPAAPQNLRITEIDEGPSRGTTALVIEWDQGVDGNQAALTDYQLGRGCAYTFTPPDQQTGSPSGTAWMNGPGPAYRVGAVCTCNRGYISIAVRSTESDWTYVPDPPGTPHPNPAYAEKMFAAPCAR